MSNPEITTVVPVSPWARKRAAPLTEAVPLPELGVTITLRSLDTLLTSAAMAEVEVLLAEHVGVDGSDAEPRPFLAEDGEEYELNANLVRDLCILRHMQVAEPRFSFAWWLGVALNCEPEYIALSQAAQRLNLQAQRRAAGNSPAPNASGSRRSRRSAG